MIKKKLIFSLFAVAALSLPSAAFAGWTGSSTIKNIRQDKTGPTYGTGSTVIRLTSESCTVSGSAEFVVTGDEETKQKMLKIVLAAFLSGTPIYLEWTSSGTNCNVRSIQIGTN